MECFLKIKISKYTVFFTGNVLSVNWSEVSDYQYLHKYSQKQIIKINNIRKKIRW